MKKPTVLFVCTGNAARSVMAAAMLRARTDEFDVISAGTHSIPGLPMSTRTRTALADFGVRDPDHRSRQLDDELAAAASIVAFFEPMHPRYIHKHHPEIADRSASLPRLARDLSAPSPALIDNPLAALDLAACEFESWEEVVDPAGGDLADFQAAASAIDALLGDFCKNVGV